MFMKSNVLKLPELFGRHVDNAAWVVTLSDFCHVVVKSNWNDH
jgi:hypothetical protein